jgi:hypothetical protein
MCIGNAWYLREIRAESGVDLLLSTGTYASDYETGFLSVGTQGRCLLFKTNRS